MKNLTLLLTGVLVLAFASVAVAGEYGACTASAQECVNYLATKAANKGYAGLDGEYNKEEHTWTVTAVSAGTPAEMAGVKVGDVIVGANGKYFKDFDEAAWGEFKKTQTPGTKVTYKVMRDGEYTKLAMTLDKMPEEEAFKMVGRHMLEHADTAAEGS